TSTQRTSTPCLPTPLIWHDPGGAVGQVLPVGLAVVDQVSCPSLDRACDEQPADPALELVAIGRPKEIAAGRLPSGQVGAGGRPRDADDAGSGVDRDRRLEAWAALRRDDAGEALLAQQALGRLGGDVALGAAIVLGANLDRVSLELRPVRRLPPVEGRRDGVAILDAARRVGAGQGDGG